MVFDIIQCLKGNKCLAPSRNRGLWQINHRRYPKCRSNADNQFPGDVVSSFKSSSSFKQLDDVCGEISCRYLATHSILMQRLTEQ